MKLTRNLPRKELNCGDEIPNLESYLVIIVKEYEEQYQKAIVVFSADLSTSIFPQSSQYFVIGSPSTNPDLSFSSASVSYRTKFLTPLQIELQLKKDCEKKQLHDVIENGNKVPLTIMLLKENNGRQLGIKQLVMTIPAPNRNSKAFVTPLVINDNLGENSLTDMYIFSRRSFINSCNLFKQIALHKSSKVYKIGTEFDVQGHVDVSVNRCPTQEEEEDEILMYTHFKIGKKTPHTANDCTGVHFTIEENVYDILERGQPCCSKNVAEDNIPSTCSVNPSVYRLCTIGSESIVEQRDCQLDITTIQSSLTLHNSEEMQCICVDQNKNVSHDNEIEVLESQITRMSELTGISEQPVCKMRKVFKPSGNGASRPTIDYELPLKLWKDHSQFQNQWLQQIQKYQSRIIASSLLNNENKVWLEYLFSENDPKHSTFRCRLCKSYLDKHPQAKNIPLLAKTSGYFVEDYLRMWKQISQHSSSLVHKRAILQSKEEYTQILKDCSQELKKKVLLKISSEHLPTVKMIRTVYTEVKINLPFTSHSIIVQLQKLNGVDLGKHHYEKTSATRITQSISNKMHKTLISHLKENKYPMSIILDTSSDAANKNYLLIYIRTIENNYPTTYFYRCLYVPNESSESLFQKLIGAFEEDNLLQTFKDQLHGFASDGAPSMLGKRSGLAKRVQDITTLYVVYTIHCLAHKLQSAMGHAL